MSENLSTGLPSRAVRLHEVEPRVKSTNYEEPLYLDHNGVRHFRKAPALSALPSTATLSDVIAWLETMRKGDADVLRNP